MNGNANVVCIVGGGQYTSTIDDENSTCPSSGGQLDVSTAPTFYEDYYYDLDENYNNGDHACWWPDFDGTDNLNGT